MIKLGIYLGYTQTMFWGLFEDSGPFKEINFKPELFFRFESGYNFLNDVVIPLFDYFQAGLGAPLQRPGRDISRGWDRCLRPAPAGGFGKTIQSAPTSSGSITSGSPSIRTDDGVDNKFLSLSDNPMFGTIRPISNSRSSWTLEPGLPAQGRPLGRAGRRTLTDSTSPRAGSNWTSISSSSPATSGPTFRSGTATGNPSRITTCQLQRPRGHSHRDVTAGGQTRFLPGPPLPSVPQHTHVIQADCRAGP